MGENSRESFAAAEAAKKEAEDKLRKEEAAAGTYQEDEYTEKGIGYAKSEIRQSEKKMNKELGKAQVEATKVNEEYEKLKADPKTTPEQLEQFEREKMGKE